MAGYVVVNDVSEREYQIERGGQWDKGKGCDSFAPIGPWLVTRDEIADPQNLGMWLEVNGKRFQDGSTRTMVFGVKQLVSYISQFMSLLPGDVISTGTPPGVGLGQKPPLYLKAGDVMRLGIEGLGVQSRKPAPGRAERPDRRETIAYTRLAPRTPARHARQETDRARPARFLVRRRARRGRRRTATRRPRWKKGWTSWRRWPPARPATRWPSWRIGSTAASARSSAWP